MHLRAVQQTIRVAVCCENHSKHINTFLGLLDLQYEDTTLLLHVGKYIYQSTRRNMSEDLNLREQRCENVKSRTHLWEKWSEILTFVNCELL